MRQDSGALPNAHGMSARRRTHVPGVRRYSRSIRGHGPPQDERAQTLTS